MAIGAIEKPVGSLKILVHLYRIEKATITMMLKDIEINQRTAYSALHMLFKEDLIEMEIRTGRPWGKFYRLTEKGKIVATYLDKVDNILEK